MQEQIVKGSAEVVRDEWDAICLDTLAPRTRKAVETLVKKVATNRVDEHGGWDFGVASGRRRGSWASLNWSLYGLGRDCHNGKLLAVVQVRQAEKAKSHYFTSIRKSYFLVGRNEDQNVFAHPVQAQVVRRAVHDDRDVIRACQAWIFGCDYSKVVRQGDLGLVPIKRLPKGALPISTDKLVVEESHRISAEQAWKNGETLYLQHPHLVHLPQTHPEVRVDGLYRLVIGCRAAAWSFAKPTVD